MYDLRVNIGGDYVDVDDLFIEKGDIMIKNGEFVVVPDDDMGILVGQRLAIRLLLRKGEVFFNTSAGFPYTETSKFKKATGVFETNMKSYIVATDGVTRLASYTGTLDNSTRKETVNFSVTTTDNTQVEVEQELDV